MSRRLNHLVNLLPASISSDYFEPSSIEHSKPSAIEHFINTIIIPEEYCNRIDETQWDKRLDWSQKENLIRLRTNGWLVNCVKYYGLEKISDNYLWEDYRDDFIG